MIAEDNTMVSISFPRQRTPRAPTSTTGTSGEPLKHIGANDEESDEDDSESIPKAT